MTNSGPCDEIAADRNEGATNGLPAPRSTDAPSRRAAVKRRGRSWTWLPGLSRELECVEDEEARSAVEAYVRRAMREDNYATLYLAFTGIGLVMAMLLGAFFVQSLLFTPTANPADDLRRTLLILAAMTPIVAVGLFLRGRMARSLVRMHARKALARRGIFHCDGCNSRFRNASRTCPACGRIAPPPAPAVRRRTRGGLPESWIRVQFPEEFAMLATAEDRKKAVEFMGRAKLTARRAMRGTSFTLPVIGAFVAAFMALISSAMALDRIPLIPVVRGAAVLVICVLAMSAPVYIANRATRRVSARCLHRFLLYRGIPFCNACGYNLSGVTSVRCSECGHPEVHPRRLRLIEQLRARVDTRGNRHGEQ